MITLLSTAATPALPQHGAPEYGAPVRIDSGRFTFVSYRSDSALASSLLLLALKTDTFPGLPRPSRRVLVALAPDFERFRDWIGPNVPEWGAAVAFPSLGRIIMQGRKGAGRAGNPAVVLRHELAHLALYEFMQGIPPRWFDEGYASFAAGEWERSEALAASLIVLLNGVPKLEDLDAGFRAGARDASATYALSHVAVADLAALDRERGLALLFSYWRDDRSLDQAVRRAYGLTLYSFEERWNRSVKRRYGALAVATDAGIVGTVLMVLLLPLYVRRRQRARERLQLLRAAEVAAERGAVLEALNQLIADEAGSAHRR